MIRFGLIAVAGFLAIALTACGESGNTPKPAATTNEPSVQVQPQPQPQPEVVPQQQPAAGEQH